MGGSGTEGGCVRPRINETIAAEERLVDHMLVRVEDGISRRAAEKTIEFTLGDMSDEAGFYLWTTDDAYRTHAASGFLAYIGTGSVEGAQNA